MISVLKEEEKNPIHMEIFNDLAVFKQYHHSNTEMMTTDGFSSVYISY